MKNPSRAYPWLIAVFCFCVFFSGSYTQAAETTPTLNKGQKWRIGYFESGAYINYQGSLKSTVQGLMDLGWIEKKPLPVYENLEKTQALWNWLADAVSSRYIEFVKSAYWSSQWKEEQRAPHIAAIKKRIAAKGDIDLFIAMGTWAGQDLAPTIQKIPVIVMSSTDPVKAKIVQGAQDSGKDNLFAWCDPTRTERRLKLFHDILGFKNLGVIYEDSEDGRIFAKLPTIRKIAKQRGFRVTACVAAESNLSLGACEQEVSRCIHQLATEVDALTLSDHRGFHPKFLPELIEPLFKNQVAVFTPVWGPTLVSRGVMMGIAREDYQPLGDFYAQTIAAVFNGSKPRDLPQIYREPLKLAINLETADIIGYDIPPNVKKIADILYDKIDRAPLGQ